MEQDNIRERVEAFINLLSASVTTRRMYGAGHRLCRASVDEVAAHLRKLLDEKGEITIGIVGREFAFEKWPFNTMSEKLSTFVDILQKNKVSKISFSSGIMEKELADFAGIIAMRPDSIEKEGGVDALIARKNIVHIITGSIGVKKSSAALSKDSAYSPNAMQRMMDELNTNKIYDVKMTSKYVRELLGTLLRNRNILEFLSKTKGHDEYTFVHNINVTIFTLLQAESFGIGADGLREIGIAAFLHDMGKLFIPREILTKQGPLTDEEKEIIFMHPVTGAKKLLEMPDVPALAALAAFEHQMHYDMKGYPKKLFGESANIVSMMITISDCYEALRSTRPYRGALAPEKVYEEMAKLSGAFFMPELFEHFFSLVGIYPMGTLVELNTGEVAIVLKTKSSDIWHPQAEVIYGKDGASLEKPVAIDTSVCDAEGRHKYDIVKSIPPSDHYRIPAKYA